MMAFFINVFLNWTPLHIAAQKDFTDVIQLLLKDNRVNVNAVTSSGTTPLHLAAAYASSEAVLMFLRHPNINVNMMNSQKILKKIINKTPYDFASQNGLNDIVLLLKKHNGVSGQVSNNENTNNSQN